MSMAPIQRDEFGIKKIDQIKSSVASAVKNPARTIFYLGLAGLLAGLMLGAEFSWQVYVIMALLWITVIYQSGMKKLDTNKIDTNKKP